MDRKNQNLYYIKILMGVINFIILSFLSAVFILTLNKINHDFGARNFLEEYHVSPKRTSDINSVDIYCFFLIVRHYRNSKKTKKKATGICDLICSRDFVMSDHY